MTTFIPYQSWENALSSRGRTFRKSPTVGLPSWVLKRQSPQHPEWARPRGNVDFVDFVDLVDLTASDHQDAAREYLVAREILEPVDHDSTEHLVRVAGDSSSDETDKGKIDDGDEDEDDNEDDIDSDHNSQASDLPSLQDIFAQADKAFRGSGDLNLMDATPEVLVDRARKERCRESGSEGRANPVATTATSVQPGANRDNPIVLDDDKAVEKHDAAAPDAEKPTFEAADPVDSCDTSPTLSGIWTEPGTDDRKNAQNNLSQYPRDGRGDDEEERGGNIHEDEVTHNDNVACGEEGGDGMGSDAPASVGLIHGVSTEYERTFSVPRRNERAVHSASHDCQNTDTTAGSIPQPISCDEPRAVADDLVTNMKQPTEAAGDDAGPGSFSRGELENGSISQPRQEGNQQWTETTDVRAECLSTLASDCGSGSALLRHTPPALYMDADEATRSDPSAVVRGARTRKRHWSSSGSGVLDEDVARCKRPRRLRKETW